MSTPEATTTSTPDGPDGGVPAARRRADGVTAVLDAPVSGAAVGATEVVEAATTEAAIAEVHQRLGPEARILDARRVLRGGIGGFFAKEHVQLHVAPGEPGGQDAAGATPVASTPVASTPVAPTAATPRRGPRPAGNPWAQVAAEGAAAPSPVDRLLAQADEVPDEGRSAIDFATFLREQLGPHAADSGADGSPPGATRDPVDSPSIRAPADDQLGRPSWPRIEIDSTRLIGGTAVHLDADGEVADPADEIPGSASAEAPPLAVGSPAASPTTSVPDLLQREPSPAQDGGPNWSVAALLALGLPIELVRSLEVDEPHDDVAWTMALAEALRPTCRPLPDGPAVFVGPCVDGFAHVDDAPVARSETWLAALRPGRWIHLVIGGDRWRRGLADSPLAASWAEPDDLPDAIRCAVELGLVLGYGPTGIGMRRARPLDVALAVRELVANR